MNPVDPMNGFQYFGAGQPNTKKSELDMDTFLRLLTVQLATQNPLEPMNDRDFFAQMAQLGQVQGLDKLQSSMDMSQAASLIGKKVTAVRPMTDQGSNGQNSIVTGTVQRVTVRDGETVLGLKEANGGIVEVKLGSVREIVA